jgi:hypothetical protein
MPNQGHLAFILHTHDTCQAAILLNAPENHTGFDFMSDLFNGHIRFVPSVIWNYTPVSLGRIVNNLEYCLYI